MRSHTSRGLTALFLAPLLALGVTPAASAAPLAPDNREEIPLVELRETDTIIPALTVFLPGKYLQIQAVSPYGEENIVCEYKLPELEKGTCWQKTPSGQWVAMMSVKLPVGSVEFFPTYKDPTVKENFEDFFGAPYPLDLLDTVLDEDKAVVIAEENTQAADINQNKSHADLPATSSTPPETTGQESIKADQIEKAINDWISPKSDEDESDLDSAENSDVEADETKV